MKAYIGQNLRTDIARLEKMEIYNFIESLRKQGVEDEVISSALSELRNAA